MDERDHLKAMTKKMNDRIAALEAENVRLSGLVVSLSSQYDDDSAELNEAWAYAAALERQVAGMREALEAAELLLNEKIEGLLHFHDEEEAADICAAIRGRIDRALADTPAKEPR